jgi:hypothetical protein
LPDADTAMPDPPADAAATAASPVPPAPANVQATAAP